MAASVPNPDSRAIASGLRVLSISEPGGIGSMAVIAVTPEPVTHTSALSRPYRNVTGPRTRRVGTGPVKGAVGQSAAAALCRFFAARARPSVWE